jgi:hypothetical protein
LGQAVATLADFEVNSSITVQTCQLVFVNELIGDIQDFDASIFGIGHRSIQIEIFEINGVGNFPREDTVEEELEEELEKLQRRCVCTHISRVADAAATNGDPCAVKVVFFLTDFTFNHGMAYFLSLVQRNVMVVNVGGI